MLNNIERYKLEWKSECPFDPQPKCPFDPQPILSVEKLPNKLNDKQQIDKNKTRVGIYFWVVEIEGRKYSMYIGKTTNLRERVNWYMRDFQVASPDDFKLRVFVEYICENYKGKKIQIQYHLYFKQYDKNKLKSMEKQYIKEYNPIINIVGTENKKSKDNPIKDKIKKIYEEYYKSLYKKKLNVETEESVS